MTIAKGFLTLMGYKKETIWAQAVQVGALQGLAFNSHTLKPTSELIPETLIEGSPMIRESTKGNEFCAGDIITDGRYQGLETMIALAMGTAGSPVQVGADDAYTHTLKIANDIEGLSATVVAWLQGLNIQEYVGCKVNSVEFSVKKGDRVKITFGLVAQRGNVNTGSPITNRIVASRAVADATYTIANQPTTPSPVSVTITDLDVSITEHIITITGYDRDNLPIQEVYHLSTDGLVWIGKLYFKSITSVVATGTAGVATADTVVVGVTNGVNNESTVTSITYPAQRQFMTFNQMVLRINDQTAGALSASDKVYVNEFSFKIDNMISKDDVTSEYGTLISEPVRDNFCSVTGSFTLSKYMTHAIGLFPDQLSKAPKKMSAVFTGPNADGTTNYSWGNWFPDIQLTEGTPVVPGPGRIPMTYNFVAKRVTTSPTGFPSGSLGSVLIQIVNRIHTDALA